MASFRDPSVHSPFNHQSSFSLIPTPHPPWHSSPIQNTRFQFFHCNCLVFNSTHPIKPRLELQPDFGEGRSSGDCWAAKILGRERRRFGRLGSGTGRKRSSLKVVCVATIKSEKLKRLSLRPASSVICSVPRERPAGAWMEGKVADDEKMDSLWATLNANFHFDIGLLCGHWAANTHRYKYFI